MEKERKKYYHKCSKLYLNGIDNNNIVNKKMITKNKGDFFKPKRRNK